MDIHEVLRQLASGATLNEREIGDVFGRLMSGELTPAQTGGLLGILATRPPHVEELVGAARAMREACLKIEHDYQILVDTCGTGGDRSGTFNISTCTSFVLAAAGVGVAKHGNRSATSQCGGADLLEAMGWGLEAEPQLLQNCLQESCFTFLFARKMHPAMRHVAPVRSELGIRTIFNFLGPMSNPAGASHQLVGISDRSLLHKYADALVELGVKGVLAVSAQDGMDEISLAAPTDVVEWRNGACREYTVKPEDTGLQSCQKGDLDGGTVEDNVRITQDILRDRTAGPKQDAVILNAGAGLYIAEKADSIREGADQARSLIQSGTVWEKVEEILNYSRAASLG